MPRLHALSLLALLLLQSLGSPLERHWCGGAIAEVTLLGVDHMCCAGAKTCPAETTLAGIAKPQALHHATERIQSAEPDDCCLDEVQWDVQNVVAASQRAQFGALVAGVARPHTPKSWIGAFALEVQLSLTRQCGRPMDGHPPLTRDQYRASLQVYLV